MDIQQPASVLLTIISPFLALGELRDLQGRLLSGAKTEGAAADLTKAKEACRRSNQETAGRLFDWPGQKDRILRSQDHRPDLSEERRACAVRCSEHGRLADF